MVVIKKTKSKIKTTKKVNGGGVSPSPIKNDYTNHEIYVPSPPMKAPKILEMIKKDVDFVSKNKSEIILDTLKTMPTKYRRYEKDIAHAIIVKQFNFKVDKYGCIQATSEEMQKAFEKYGVFGKQTK